jgi:ABC-2 type transport system ATP-binding protein
LTFAADSSAAPLVADIASRYEIADLSILEPNIEDVIKRIYTSTLPDHTRPPDRAD